MIEIRTIRIDEADAFLRLMCGVFDLDFARAESVFFTEPFYDLERKWALFIDGQMVSILTTTPLSFGWGDSEGIAGVATDPQYRDSGFATKLLEFVVNEGQKAENGSCILFARAPEVYAKVGFQTIDHVVRGPIVNALKFEPGPLRTNEEVMEIYVRWALSDPRRLRRDSQRWKFWNWLMRVCEAADSGYICHEAAQVREAIVDRSHAEWPVAPGTEWVGLESMTQVIGVPLVSSERTLLVMGLNLPDQPHLFMTDQF